MKSEYIGHKSAERHCCFFTDLIESFVAGILNSFLFLLGFGIHFFVFMHTNSSFSLPCMYNSKVKLLTWTEFILLSILTYLGGPTAAASFETLFGLIQTNEWMWIVMLRVRHALSPFRTGRQAIIRSNQLFHLSIFN